MKVEDILKGSMTSSNKARSIALKGEESAGERMLKSAKILERMVNLNTFDEIAQDFRFWEDASDEFKASFSILML